MRIETFPRTNVLAGLTLIGLAAAVPVSAVSLSSTAPAQPIPANELTSSPIENWTAGSAALVPLMAAERQANGINGVEAPAGKTGGAGKPVDDVVFVTKATESGVKEVAAARDAIPKLKNPELKRMAEMLVKDHTSANAKLSKIAAAKGWPAPPPRTDAPSPAPSVEPAGNFEQNWTAEMIAGHERSVALYRAQAQGGDDKDLRQFASDTLPTIEHHLAELRKLQK